MIVETSVTYGRRILRGISNYLRAHRQWSVFLEQRELGAGPPKWLLDWRGDGIICRPTTPRLAEAFRASGIPVVDLNDAHGHLGLPHIGSDMGAIGRIGAEHLLERGFRSFAYCGFAGQRWSALRHDGFMKTVQRAGCAGHSFESKWPGLHAPQWDQDQARIAAWILELPKPVALMACNDLRGQHVLDACRRINLAVPEEVAVIGVDDDRLLCEFADPPLSTVVPAAERIGYQAAELLDRLMSGRRTRCHDRLIEPSGVVTRQSTDVLAISDSEVAAAVRYIREHACGGITMNDLLRHVPLSRSVLEHRFRKYLGRSPQAEIRSVRLKRARQLLADTDLPLHEIAQLTGFEHAEYFNVVFKRMTAQTPGTYRREHQTAATHIPATITVRWS